MGEIIKLSGNVWEASHVFAIGPLNRRLQVDGSASVFNVRARRVVIADSFHLLVTVTAEDGQPFHADYELGPYSYSSLPAMTGRLDNNKHTSERIQFGKNSYTCSMPIKLTFHVLDELTDTCQKFGQLTLDFQSYINRGRNITINGADGSVTVSKRLLHLRSEAFEAMFKHDSKEKQTGQIDMSDFDAKTLGAFVHFLETGTVKDGIDTALGLILLGDKYDIQYMKKVAEKFVRENIELMDQDEVLDVYHKVNRESLKEAMVGYWSKNRKVQQ